MTTSEHFDADPSTVTDDHLRRLLGCPVPADFAFVPLVRDYHWRVYYRGHAVGEIAKASETTALLTLYAVRPPPMPPDVPEALAHPHEETTLTFHRSRHGTWRRPLAAARRYARLLTPIRWAWLDVDRTDG